MSKTWGLRQIVATTIAATTLAGGWGAAQPAFADDRAAYYSACVKQSDNKTLCSCLADLAMAADPQLRADMIMSMSQPDKYRSTRAPHVPNGGKEMGLWEAFDDQGHDKCGMDI